MPSTGNATADIIIYLGTVFLGLLFALVTYFVKGHIDNTKESISSVASKFDHHAYKMAEHKEQMQNVVSGLHRDLEDHRKLNRLEFQHTTKELHEIRKEALLLEKSIDKSQTTMVKINDQLVSASEKIGQLTVKVDETTDRVNKSLVILKRHGDEIKNMKTEVKDLGNNVIMLKTKKDKGDAS